MTFKVIIGLTLMATAKNNVLINHTKVINESNESVVIHGNTRCPNNRPSSSWDFCLPYYCYIFKVCIILPKNLDYFSIDQVSTTDKDHGQSDSAWYQNWSIFDAGHEITFWSLLALDSTPVVCKVFNMVLVSTCCRSLI